MPERADGGGLVESPTIPRRARAGRPEQRARTGEWLLGLIDKAATLPAPHGFDSPQEFRALDGQVLVTVRSLEDAVGALKRVGRPFRNLAAKDVREVLKSHVYYVVADTRQWEQSAAYALDTHPLVAAFVKNAGLGFAIPCVHNGQTHDYQPDFIVRLKTDPVTHLILEPKGFDELADIKAAAAERWAAAINADGQYGFWCDRQVRQTREMRAVLDEFDGRR